MEREYRKLEDGSISIKGLNIEAHISEDGTIYDADGVTFGELTTDKTAIVLWDEETVAHQAIADNAAKEGL
jgi:hypothetical protein